jgi:type IV pilus assembly protein PilO
MKILELNELTLTNLALWPLPIKIGVIVMGCLLIIGLGYGFDVRMQLSLLNKTKQNQANLQAEFQMKAAQAGKVVFYEKQLQTLQQVLADMVKQLPNSTEIPNLLEEVSKLGVANGLHFQLFKLMPENKLKFINELPLQISVIGNYHQLALFINQTASLNRIVTLQDFTIEPSKAKAAVSQKENDAPAKECLIMNLTAKTYRYSNETYANKKLVDDKLDITTLTAQPFHAMPTLKNHPISKYEVANLRSPFHANAIQAFGAKRIKGPLESFPLDALHLVGIIARANQTWGLMATPNGKHYPITIGQYIGLNNGKVMAIHPDYLELVESVAEGNQVTEHYTKLSLGPRAQPAAIKEK